MESDDTDERAFPVAGECVEVIDARHKFFGQTGTIVYFVGDNVYVKLAGRRWSPTMFFPEQLRAVPAPLSHPAGEAALSPTGVPRLDPNPSRP